MSDMPRVLVVEDEPNVLRYVVHVLEHEGFEVSPAADAELALDLLGQLGGMDLLLADALATRHMLDERGAILLSDIKLPGMCGCELAHEVLRRWPGMRVLFMSGYGAQELIERGICPRGLPLLPKPFRPEDLIQAVERTLREPPWDPAEWRAP